MKKTFEKAEIKIISFDNVDVLSASSAVTAAINSLSNALGTHSDKLKIDNGKITGTDLSIDTIQGALNAYTASDSHVKQAPGQFVPVLIAAGIPSGCAG